MRKHLITLVCVSGLAVSASAQEGDPAELLRQRREEAAAAQQERIDAQREPVQPDEVEPAAPLESEEGMFRLDALSEAVDLETFVNLVAEALEIQIVERSTITGTFTINAPRDIPESKLLDLLVAMLDQWDYALTYDADNDFYIVQSNNELTASVGGEFAATQVISTPNVRPSALKAVIEQQLGTAPASGGQSKGIAYLDELGIIVVTASPRRVKLLRELIDAVIGEYTSVEYIRIPVTHLSAPVARERAIALVGGGTASQSNRVLRAQDAVQAAIGQGGGQLDNLADRLTVDTQGNALIFSGKASEVEQVLRVIGVIDKTSTLIPKKYYAGASAQQLADIARQRGLGEVTTLNSVEQQLLAGRQAFDPQGQNPFAQQQSQLGGSGMVVDPQKGVIVYYATPEQHEQMARLIEELDPGSERVVIRTYKLHHAAAAETADLILSLLENQRPTAEGGLLPVNRLGQAQQQQFDPSAAPVDSGDELGALGAGPNTFVIADDANNQLLVKAPVKQQDEFRKLIEKLDLRRPSVYIEAQIVAVSSSVDFNLAVETQVINAGGESGAFQTNFGLTSPGDTFIDPRLVATGLSGFTGAFLLSDYTPIVINALQRDVNARIVSTPQLLVDDNEEASIVSVEQQPTTTTSQGDATTQTSFGGFEDAGTTLTVTPRISPGGLLGLEYEITLSNFVGEGSNGIPAARQERTIGAASVTVPSDRTIIVGGIKVEDTSNSVAKVPFIGDIPLVGLLFSDTKERSNDTTLYVFITPRIMSDPNFLDLELVTRGPQAEVELEPDVPELKPVRMELVVPEAPSSPARTDDAGVVQRRDGR